MESYQAFLCMSTWKWIFMKVRHVKWWEVFIVAYIIEFLGDDNGLNLQTYC